MSGKLGGIIISKDKVKQYFLVKKKTQTLEDEKTLVKKRFRSMH